MRSQNIERLTLSLLMLGISQSGWSEEAEQDTVLDTVVVSGSRVETLLSETPVAIGSVSNNAIKQDKPKTIGEIINRIAGVHWNDLGNEQHSMGIRQPITTNAVYQYLEDGIPIRPLGVFNHNSLNEMNMSSVENVEVVKGAASSLYGSNAMGGAVNFITAPPSPTPYASVGLRHDWKDGFERVDTVGSNTWGDFGLRFSQYSSRRSRDNWQQYSNGAKDSFTLRSDYFLSGGSLLHAVLSHNNLDSATPGSLDPRDFNANPGKSYQTFSYRKDKSTRLTAAWEGETLPNGLTTATFFGRINDHGQLPSYTISSCTVGATCPTGYRGTENNNHVSSLGLDIKHQQELDWLSSRLIAGLYFDRSPNTYWSNNLNVTRDTSNVYTSYTASTNFLTGVRNYQAIIHNTALFGQWESSPLEKVRVVVGGRSDFIKYDFTNFLNSSSTGSANFGAPSESRRFSHFSPKIGATYAVDDKTSVYANVSEGFRPPEVSELYGKSVIPDLKPSTSDNMEVGLRKTFLADTLKLEAALYRLDGHDSIVSYTISPGNSINQNAGQTRSQGLEMNLAWDPHTAFDGRMGFGFASHRYVKYVTSTSLDYSGKEMPAAPDEVNAEIGYKPIADARVALEVVRQGGYWMNNANTVRYAGHTLFNLRANYKFAKGWEAWLQGRNLTNQLYANSASSSYSGTGTYTPNTVGTTAGMDSYAAGAPRSLMVGLNYTFDGGQ